MERVDILHVEMAGVVETLESGGEIELPARGWEVVAEARALDAVQFPSNRLSETYHVVRIISVQQALTVGQK